MAQGCQIGTCQDSNQPVHLVHQTEMPQTSCCEMPEGAFKRSIPMLDLRSLVGVGQQVDCGILAQSGSRTADTTSASAGVGGRGDATPRGAGRHDLRHTVAEGAALLVVLQCLKEPLPANQSNNFATSGARDQRETTEASLYNDGHDVGGSLLALECLDLYAASIMGSEQSHHWNVALVEAPSQNGDATQLVEHDANIVGTFLFEKVGDALADED
mmetsp:Transcript_45436/g.98079  ORF Transcript_45436/g.98079 Transcript_45436/m.98079 type:complete len:215 (-) Transcript_45436:851-1495(-)